MYLIIATLSFTTKSGYLKIDYARLKISGLIITRGEYSNPISINSLTPGIYLFWFRDDQKSTFLKFVKQ